MCYYKYILNFTYIIYQSIFYENIDYKINLKKHVHINIKSFDEYENYYLK